MSNALYQVAVQQLEAILAPRVVSRSLQEGLRQVGRSPDTVDYDTIELILKGQIYRQLQISMPVTDAKSTVATVLDKIRDMSVEPAATDAAVSATGLELQGERLAELLEALKPYNMYFEWPEVQKLRAQVQLLESEQDAGREATSLVSDASDQLAIVAQKLEDQLVIQARDLGDLSDAMEVVRGVGGAKVRRLENLLNHIRDAQESRQLAQAEVERARRLARDLRKLMESSVYSEDPPETDVSAALLLDDEVPTDGVLDVETEEEELLSIDRSSLDPEVSARLLLLDLEGERYDVEALLTEYAVLFGHQPALREALESLLPRISADESVADEIEALRITLAEAFSALRRTLEDELTAVDASLSEVRPEVDTSELHQGLRVALGILATTLPSSSDVTHLRHLHQLVLEQADAFDRAAAETREQLAMQLHDQASLLDRLESTLLRYEGNSAAEDEYERLRAEVEELRGAHLKQTLVPGIRDKVMRAEESLESAMAVKAGDRIDRQRASLRNLLVRVNGLPALDTVANRISSIVAEIERQLARLESDAIDDAQIETIQGLIGALQQDAGASIRRKLDAFAEQAAEIDDALLLERIRAAAEALDEGSYPDLAALRAAIKQARDVRRSEQVGVLHRLEGEAARFAGSESPAFASLTERLTEARERVEQGALAQNLQQAWDLLDRVEGETKARLGSVSSRLDTALERFHRVEKLNSDDVATVRRILQHLDSQRDAFERVSVGLRLQLESSLREAEQLLEKLGEEYEATRVIADQLVSANVFDDVFGFLGGDQDEDAPDVDALLAAYAAEAEVMQAIVVDDGGGVVHGDEGDTPPLRPELAQALRRAADAVATDLGDGGIRILTFEYAGGALLAAWPLPGRTVLLRLRSASEIALLAGRLRRDLPAFTAAMRATTDAATPS